MKKYPYTYMKRLFLYLSVLLLFSCGSASHDNKSAELYPIKEYGKWGYINSKGETVIKCQFDGADPFYEDLAAVQIGDYQGYIDKTGKMIIPAYYNKALFSHCSDGLVRIMGCDQYKFVKADGTDAFSCSGYMNVSNFSNGRATVEINDEVCIIDKSGNIVFNTHHTHHPNSNWSQSRLEDGVVMVERNDTTRYFNQDGQLIIEFKGHYAKSFSDSLARVYINGKKAYINTKGKIALMPHHQNWGYHDFSEGLALVDNKHFNGFINKSGKLVFSIQCKECRLFKNGLAAFKDNNDKWGFIDKTGTVVIQPQFDEVETFIGSLCRVEQGDNWGYINRKGEFVWKDFISFEHTHIDLAKWKLDSFEFNEYFYIHMSLYEIKTKKQVFEDLNQITLKVDTTDLTVFDDKYLANKLYVINASKDTMTGLFDDAHLDIMQQAKNKKGEWQDLYWAHGSFGFGEFHYYSFKLPPNEYITYPVPIFKGAIKTSLRYRLRFDNKIIYSNTFTGQVNETQFINYKSFQ